MGKVVKEGDVQTKPQSGDSVKAQDLRDFYNSGAYSPAEVAEEFNVEESDVTRVLGLDKNLDLDEFNQPVEKATKAETPAAE